MPKKTGAVATPSANGRWKDEQAAGRWARDHQLRPTRLQEAGHEAGHAVAAHALGVNVTRVAVGLWEERDTIATRLGVTATGALRSVESTLIGSLGGRIEDERHGVYTAFHIKPGMDEWGTLECARALSPDDPLEAARLIAGAWDRGKHILDAQQAGIAKLTAALVEEGALDAARVVEILGTRPVLAFEPGMRDYDPTRTALSQELLHACLPAMMKDHPFAVAVLHTTPPRLVYFNMNGELSHAAFLSSPPEA